MKSTSKGPQTEYNPLKKVVVGRIDSGNIFPHNDLGMLSIIASDLGLCRSDEMLDIESAKRHIPEISDSIVTKTQQELQMLSKMLREHNIEVLHPEMVPKDTKVSTLNYTTKQFPVYCPRDIILHFRNLVIISPNSYQSRINESIYYEEILNLERNEGKEIIFAPRPNLDENDFNLQCSAQYVIDTDKPVFEAANVLIDGEHNAIYYQISHSGNHAGYAWMKETIRNHYPDVEVYPIEIYNGTHIDTTIAILNYKTVALNPERVKNIDDLPEPLRNREHIYPNIEDTRNEGGLSSKWIGMNTLSIEPNKIIVDERQKSYAEQLHKSGFDVILHRLTYSDLLEGGHHCVTSDMIREESYN